MGGKSLGVWAVSACFSLAWGALTAPALHAQPASPSAQLAPGFDHRPIASTLLVIPPDLELFSISAGGVSEPRADWTTAAQRNLREALHARRKVFGTRFKELTALELDDFSELVALHAALAEAVSLHHVKGGIWRLPTKPGGLDWSLGDAVAPLRAKTSVDYALFFWIRDSYASAERKAAMIAMALLGVGLTGGAQVGYASLVDLREPGSAAETLDALLLAFPRAPSRAGSPRS